MMAPVYHTIFSLAMIMIELHSDHPPAMAVNTFYIRRTLLLALLPPRVVNL